MGKIVSSIIVIGVLALGTALLGCHKRDMIVVADEPTKIYKDYPASGPPNQNDVVGTLGKGETGVVLTTRYSKDFMYYKIKLKDGREGYVWFGDKFKVITPNS